MAGEAEAIKLLYELVRGVNIAITASQQLNVSLDDVAQTMRQAHDEGRSVSLDELADLAAESDDARASLKAEIERQRNAS